jgi:hypothetical protein
VSLASGISKLAKVGEGRDTELQLSLIDGASERGGRGVPLFRWPRSMITSSTPKAKKFSIAVCRAVNLTLADGQQGTRRHRV